MGDVPVVVSWLLDATIVVSTVAVVCVGEVVSVIGILAEEMVSFKLMLELV